MEANKCKIICGGLDKQLKQLLEILPENLIKKTYCPTIEKITSFENDGNFDKFGGMPSMKLYDDEDEDEDVKDNSGKKYLEWPCCAMCGEPMRFFFQLTNPFNNKTVQMFQCTKGDCYTVCDDRSSYLQYINYKECIPFSEIHKHKLFCKNQNILNDVKKYSYNYFVDTDEEYLHNWLNKKYTVNTYQCYKVVKFVSHTELGDLDDIISYLQDNEYVWNCHCHSVSDCSDAKCTYIHNYDICSEKCKRHEKYSDSECDCFSHVYYHQICYSLKFGGTGPSCQGKINSKYILHFGTSCSLPFMWGDAGYAHVSDNLDITYDCS